MKQSRKGFLKSISLIATGSAFLPANLFAYNKVKPGIKMKLGLVTYLWAKDWDIPTIISVCP